VPLTFFVAALGPAMEEVFFRGFAYAGLRRRIGAFAGACVSSAAFAALHMHWIAFTPIFLLGLFLAYLYEISGSLVPSITAHALHNVLMVALTLSFKGLSS
jgi:membrane protease YdiL (CAAX protease family)